jgi:hypothetical protein
MNFGKTFLSPLSQLSQTRFLTDKYKCPKDTPDGMMFPIHGAPASTASRLRAFSAIDLPILLVALVTATLRA